jgi:hypothetical protein
MGKPTGIKPPFTEETAKDKVKTAQDAGIPVTQNS